MSRNIQFKNWTNWWIFYDIKSKWIASKRTLSLICCKSAFSSNVAKKPQLVGNLLLEKILILKSASGKCGSVRFCYKLTSLLLDSWSLQALWTLSIHIQIHLFMRVCFRGTTTPFFTYCWRSYRNLLLCNRKHFIMHLCTKSFHIQTS